MSIEAEKTSGPNRGRNWTEIARMLTLDARCITWTEGHIGLTYLNEPQLTQIRSDRFVRVRNPDTGNWVVFELMDLTKERYRLVGTSPSGVELELTVSPP